MRRVSAFAFPLYAWVMLAAASVAREASVAPRPRPGQSIPYPKDAQTLGVVGDVVFVARVDQQGNVTSVDVREVPMRGVGFEETVRKAVMKWRFEPAMEGGHPRSGEHLGRVTFRLRPEDEAAITETVARFTQAWNGNDAAAFAATFDEDLGSVRTAIGPGVKGRDAIRAWAAHRFRSARPLMSVRFGGVSFSSADLATARLPLEGLERDLYVLLTKRSEGRWLIRSLDDAALVGSASAAYRVGEAGVAEPKKLRGAVLVYPEAAKSERVEGTVILDCLISEQGEVADIQVVQGPDLLQPAAIAAVRQWRYEPTILNGHPVSVRMTVTVNFRLQ